MKRTGAVLNQPRNTMNDDSRAPVRDQVPNGPSKNTSKIPLGVLLLSVLAVLVIAGLAYYVIAGHQPVAGATEQERDVAARIQKVGSVEIRDASRAPRTGEEVFKAQCTNCHTAGLIGAPKFGDTAAWAARIKTGYDALFNSAVKGKNAMPPQGGGDLSELEIGRAVVYMANTAGAKFEEPKPAPAAAAEALTAVK